MNESPRSRTGVDLTAAVGIVAGLKGFMVWLGGSLAGLTAILYVCGYLITTAHIYTLGLYGLVDFSKDYFLLEGAKFVLAIVISIAQTIIGPTSILAAMVLAPIALAIILTKGPLARTWKRLAAWYEPHENPAWTAAAGFVLYCALLITGATIAFESLRAISFHLQIADLLYSTVDPGKCRSELIQVRDAFLCGRFAALRSAFSTQLWSALKLVALSCIAWYVVGRWRWRAWLISPLAFVTVLLILMLPMEFGALLRPTRYPVVRVQLDDHAPGSPVRDQFLIDRNERGFTVWDPSTHRVTWIPAGNIARIETIAVRELFDKPAGNDAGSRR